MIPPRTPTDDIIAELDSDFENLSTMSSPVLSSFSPISTSCNDGEYTSALPDPKVVVLDNNACEEDVEPLPPLQSFVPIIEMLPGLHLEGNTYYANTPLIQEDLKAFIAHARRIEELVLTDVGRDKHPRLSQDVITRLALIQDVKTPFLSSLKRLDLISVDAELAYLWLCLTPSLETLVVDGIPPARQPTIAAFLAELVGSAPRLAHLVLGSGIPPSAFWTSVRFAHLRELRIDVAAALEFAFLEAVAALPVLALFDIDARAAEYTPYISPADTTTADGRDAAISAAEPRGGAPAPFPCLKTLAVAGTVLLIHDLLHCLLPRGVEHVSLTLVRHGILPIPAHWSPPLPVSSEPVVEAAVENILEVEHSAAPAPFEPPSAEVASAMSEEVDDDGSLLPEIPHHTFRTGRTRRTVVCQGDRWITNTSRTCPECMEKQRLRLITEEQQRLYRENQHQVQRRLEEERCKAQRLLDTGKSNILLQTTHFASVIEHILKYANPRSIYINRKNMMSSSTSASGTVLLDPPVLPLSTLRKLFSCPSLVMLEVEDWVLTSVNETLLELPSPSESPLLMEILRLPIEEYLNSGVALSTLPSVARLYPHLLEFQTRVVQCAAALVRDLELCVTDHDLKELSFGGESPGTMDDMLKIAPYICFLFPHLERITTNDGHGAEGWKAVHELVKMCQQVRDTDKRNFYLGA